MTLDLSKHPHLTDLERTSLEKIDEMAGTNADLIVANRMLRGELERLRSGQLRWLRYMAAHVAANDLGRLSPADALAEVDAALACANRELLEPHQQPRLPIPPKPDFDVLGGLLAVSPDSAAAMHAGTYGKPTDDGHRDVA